MSKSLYITAVESQSGKSAVSLGILSHLIKTNPNLAFFRPVISNSFMAQDNDIELMRQHFQLKHSYEEAFALTLSEARQLFSEKRTDLVLEKVMEKFRYLQKHYDFVLCEGSDLESATTAFEFDINLLFAENLGTPLLYVYNTYGKDIAKIKSSLEFALLEAQVKKIPVTAIALNRLLPEREKEVMQNLQKSELFKDVMLFALSESEFLSHPTLREVKTALEAEVLLGHDNLGRLSCGYTMAAMQVDHFLQVVKAHHIVITPCDRMDILLACMLTANWGATPLSGLVLTDGGMISKPIMELFQKSHFSIPILHTKLSTYEVSKKLIMLHPRITPDSHEKISLALSLFEKAVQNLPLGEKIRVAKSDKITPKMFEFFLIEKARSLQKHIVLPEGEDERILQAARILTERGVVKITLLGKEEIVREKIARLGLDLKVELIDPEKSPWRNDFAREYYELRKHKGISPQMADELMTNVNYFGTMLVHRGLADGMVSGAIHTTAETIRPALQIIKTRPGISRVSSVFFMCLQDRVLVYGDCAINPNPSAEELAEIAIASAKTAKAFGIEPRVAMLSYSSGSSGEGEEVEKVRKATELVRQKEPELPVEGPIQYDAAMDPEVAKVKMPGSTVAGHATVFIFPDLNTGNNTYKAVQRTAGAIAVGPVLQGLRKPVNDLSRGCTVADIVSTVAITAIQAGSI
ncbi:MAG: phosphate acetyltransferase [Leptospiraceae bacterium]|nr:phosphate acetyltransferase [Leptospiraceae bacterium]